MLSIVPGTNELRDPSRYSWRHCDDVARTGRDYDYIAQNLTYWVRWGWQDAIDFLVSERKDIDRQRRQQNKNVDEHIEAEIRYRHYAENSSNAEFWIERAWSEVAKADASIKLIGALNAVRAEINDALKFARKQLREDNRCKCCGGKGYIS